MLKSKVVMAYFMFELLRPRRNGRKVNWISTIHLCKGVLLYLCITSSLPFWTKLAFLHFFVCCYLPLTVNSLFTGVAQSGKKPKIVGRHNFDLKNFYFSVCSSVLLKVLKSQNEILQFSQKRTENVCPSFQKWSSFIAINSP